jgi:hypothetical protein
MAKTTVFLLVDLHKKLSFLKAQKNPADAEFLRYLYALPFVKWHGTP